MMIPSIAVDHIREDEMEQETTTDHFWVIIIVRRGRKEKNDGTKTVWEHEEEEARISDKKEWNEMREFVLSMANEYRLPDHTRENKVHL